MKIKKQEINVGDYVTLRGKLYSKSCLVISVNKDNKTLLIDMDGDQVNIDIKKVIKQNTYW